MLKSFFTMILLFVPACSRAEQTVPKTMAYILQADVAFPSREAAVRGLEKSGRDLIVVDSAFSGGEGGLWTKAEIETIRKGKKERKVLAYLSIGEAESYRPYWKEEWKENPPSFIVAENPEWKGSYKVKYWHPEWQKIVLKNLKTIQDQSFDGIYMDIVDAFQFFEHDPLKNVWEEGKINSETGRSYRQGMVRWVLQIAKRARRKNKSFWIVPQNGPQLLVFGEFSRAVNAIGLEDFLTLNNQKQPEERMALILKYLEPLTKAKKPVYLIEYADRPDLTAYSRQKAAELGFSLLVTNRLLTRVGEVVGPKE